MLTPPPQSDVHLIKKGEKVGASVSATDVEDKDQ